MAAPTMTVMITRARSNRDVALPADCAPCEYDEMVRGGRLHDDPQGSRRCDGLCEHAAQEREQDEDDRLSGLS